jgi:folate-binding protein YgfZ
VDNGDVTTEEFFYSDRSERGKLSFSGPQRAWFMHQVLTQAFEDMAPGEARDAAMITAHGRMTGYLEVIALEDRLLAHFEPVLRETLPEAVTRYVFATRVEIDDVTEEWGLVIVGGRGYDAVNLSDVIVHPTSGLGAPAAYLWVPRGRVSEVVAAVESAGARRADEPELERIRVTHGVPRWGHDMDAKSFPQEAGIDDLAVHYDKGCYLGQEAMAKIRFRGKVNRRLRRLQCSRSPEPGADVVLDGERVGRVTSAADGCALALLRHTVTEGARVVAGGVDATVVA